VRDPRQIERVVSLGGVTNYAGIRRLVDREVELTFARCDKCRMRQARAGLLLAIFPRLRPSLGARSRALHLVDSALAVLDLLGVESPLVDSLVETDVETRRLVDRLAGLGAEAAWTFRFLPYIDLDGDPETCSPTRWAHVSDDLGQRMRDAFAGVLSRRLERPVPISPPSDGAPGCLLCGVGAVEALPSAAVWSGPWNPDTGTLGARGGQRVRGYLCAICSDIAESVGGIGPSAVERALVVHLNVRRHSAFDVEIGNVRAWCAMPAGTPPNLAPWAHEPHLDQLAEHLRWG
jgi:hypothetical protein